MATSTTPIRDVDQVLGPLPTSTGRVGGTVLSHAAGPQLAAVSQRGTSARGTRHFFRHFGEMVLAMWVGMIVFGLPYGGILAAAGTSVRDAKESAPEVFALVMAVNMAAGMTLWMRHRDHSWRMCVEMAGAMVVPAVAAIVLFWIGMIPSDAVVGVEHVGMFPAMIAVMLPRRSEYSQPVHRHLSGGRDRPARRIARGDQG
jgi:hypothetical protein